MASEKSKSWIITEGTSCRAVLAMPHIVAAATLVMVATWCSPTCRPNTPHVRTTMGIFATSPFAMHASKSPNSTQTCVAALSDMFMAQMTVWLGARSAASTVGSGSTCVGLPQYLRPATTWSRTSLGTALSATGQACGPQSRAEIALGGSTKGRFGAVLRYSCVIALACSTVALSTASEFWSPVCRNKAKASRAHFKPSSRSQREKYPLANVCNAD
mmetsp:Transcript_40185/g.129047  ORF Transcript_40185/g.129047 Transcript_40185/m.129047 type:complete len:216 (+) Transcript_40185:457-1104(+)